MTHPVTGEQEDNTNSTPRLLIRMAFSNTKIKRKES